MTPDFNRFYLPHGLPEHAAASWPLTARKIHFIRFTTAEATFTLLNETWQLYPQRWAGKSIRATLDTQQQEMRVYHQAGLSKTCREIACFPYRLREEAIPLQPQFQRERPALWMED